MATKAVKAAMTGAHTAGIYADLTVDGPDIGTLIVIVDRAKNLPNRKTMGKQNPYCAARLGKEAKKTETDKRGGQTPRWDQELRFTVRDSPDYHQLKVSVFNDDKRTDLIGETWVPLDKILLPGGGQNDLWHNLNYKGRYAGEVRIELTYYDTRPKEEQAAGGQENKSTPDVQDRASHNVDEPKQPKTMKRRPLPTNPSSADSLPRRPEIADDPQPPTIPYNTMKTRQNIQGPTPHPSHDTLEYRQRENHQLPLRGHNALDLTPCRNAAAYEPREDDHYVNTPSDYDLPVRHEQQFAVVENRDVASRFMGTPSSMQHPELPDTPSAYSATRYEVRGTHHPQPQYAQPSPLDLPQLPPYNPRVARPVAWPIAHQFTQGDSYSNHLPTVSPSYSSPDIRQHPQASRDNGAYLASSPSTNDGYQEPHPRHRRYESAPDTIPLPQYPAYEPEGPPPPPPVHRSSGLSTPTHTIEPDHHRSFLPGPVTAPLTIRYSMANQAPSPLSQSVMDMTENGHPLSASPGETQLSYATPLVTSYGTYPPPVRHHSHDPESHTPIRQYSHPTPPSLVAGYDPRLSDAEFDLTRRSRPISTQVAYDHSFAPGNDSHPSAEGRYGHPTARYEGRNAHVSSAIAHARREHRNSAPIIRARGSSPHPRTPMRKSVSPQPESAPPEHHYSSVPFSPDSYNTLNPNLEAASGINEAGSKYPTPEQARHPGRQPEPERKGEDEPIIGPGGRIIDPSDHLPTHNWAPEPERKPARKGPEVTLRFRASPQGAQPMPEAAPRLPRETVIQPRLVTAHGGAGHAYSAESVSPTVAARNRLVKKAPGRPTHVSSSPALVTMGAVGGLSSSSSSSSVGGYPLREQVHNNGYGNGGGTSPTHSRRSPAVAPLIPAKVPLAPGSDEWRTDALRHELQRIDIGGGMGRGGRRSRYGA